jgi:peptidoglycan hydrolase CwlO-like protein
MLDSNTTYLLLAMAGFVFAAVVLVHGHNCNDTIKRKSNQVHNITEQLGKKINVLEQEVVDLQTKIGEVDDQINSLEE